MKTLTFQEAEDWCAQCNIGIDVRGAAVRNADGLAVRRFEVPKEASRHLWFCKTVERAMRPWSECLLWVTTLGVWPSSENWHLYYRLRESYGDRRHMGDAPAHLFLDFEASDLVSFLQVGLMAGWDMSLATVDDYARVFISHDEWVEVAMKDTVELDELMADLVRSNLKSLPPP